MLMKREVAGIRAHADAAQLKRAAVSVGAAAPEASFTAESLDQLQEAGVQQAA